MSASALSTDLYELTMLAGYHKAGLAPRATFDLFVRALPPTRKYLIAAGLDQALDFLANLRFTDEEIRYLREVPTLRHLDASFFDECLPSFRFRGDVWAMEEGTPVFAGEPILSVEASLGEAQVVETALLALITFQTSVASRASRVVEAAAGRGVMEFGARRAHGVEAGLLAARAAYLAGCESTSYVEAGHRFDIPVSGTMAHSWVLAFPTEDAAFRQYAATFPESATLLLDTYDTVAAARHVVASGLRPRAVRLDSGDLVDLSRQVRAILDAGGLASTRIVVSGDLDEHRVQAIVGAGAPIDGFGVGTSLSTSSDAPALSGVYKLVAIERGGTVAPVRKRSPGKSTMPGRKQVWRTLVDGVMTGDVIALADEPAPDDAVALLEPVMKGGQRLSTPSLAVLRARRAAKVAELPHALRTLDGEGRYPVSSSAALSRLTASV